MAADAKTGPLVKQLAEGVKADLGAVITTLTEARKQVEDLGESSRAINGLGTACGGWSEHLNTLIGEVQKEQREVPAKLLGQPIHEITSSVSPTA